MGANLVEEFTEHILLKLTFKYFYFISYILYKFVFTY